MKRYVVFRMWRSLCTCCDMCVCSVESTASRWWKTVSSSVLPILSRSPSHMPSSPSSLTWVSGSKNVHVSRSGGSVASHQFRWHVVTPVANNFRACQTCSRWHRSKRVFVFCYRSEYGCTFPLWCSTSSLFGPMLSGNVLTQEQSQSIYLRAKKIRHHTSDHLISVLCIIISTPVHSWKR